MEKKEAAAYLGGCWPQNYSVRSIRLSNGLSVLVDPHDYDRLNVYHWYAHRNGDRSKVYARRTIQKGKRITYIWMHREILNAPDGVYIDHKDGNGLDNRRSNLRCCSPTQNGQNRQKHHIGTSSFKGVSWKRGNAKWRAQICIKGKRCHIGYFNTELDAAKAYDISATNFFGSFSKLNFPEVAI